MSKLDTESVVVMIEQLTRYYVPLRDDMSKFEDLCERKRLKKKDLNIIFEHLDINYKTQAEVLKARAIQKPLDPKAQIKKKTKKDQIEVMMWVSLITSCVSMIAAVTVLLVLLVG